MFGKKKSQEQSMSNVTVNGGVVQQAQAGRDLVQSSSGNLETQQQITNTEVIKQLGDLETAVKSSSLTQEQKDEILDYLRPAQREAAKKEGSKDLVGQNLKQVNETLKTLKETTETGKSLWKTGQAVFKAIAPWLGTAAAILLRDCL